MMMSMSILSLPLVQEANLQALLSLEKERKSCYSAFDPYEKEKRLGQIFDSAPISTRVMDRIRWGKIERYRLQMAPAAMASMHHPWANPCCYLE